MARYLGMSARHFRRLRCEPHSLWPLHYDGHTYFTHTNTLEAGYAPHCASVSAFRGENEKHLIRWVTDTSSGSA